MEEFTEQVDMLKRIFERLPTELVAAAIDHLDQAVEAMANSVVYVPDSMDCLVNAGQSVVQDFLHLEAGSQEILPSTSSSSSQQAMFEFPSADNPGLRELYCFTCGDVFNNRKSLYRHGKSTSHKTRRFKYNREVKKIQPSNEEHQRKRAENEEPIRDFSEISNILEEDDVNMEGKAIENPSLTCLECGEIFKNRKALYRHGNRTNHILRLRKAEKSKGGPVKCEKCKYSTANEANLRRHMQRSHGE